MTTGHVMLRLCSSRLLCRARAVQFREEVGYATLCYVSVAYYYCVEGSAVQEEAGYATLCFSY